MLNAQEITLNTHLFKMFVMPVIGGWTTVFISENGQSMTTGFINDPYHQWKKCDFLARLTPEQKFKAITTDSLGKMVPAVTEAPKFRWELDEEVARKLANDTGKFRHPNHVRNSLKNKKSSLKKQGYDITDGKFLAEQWMKHIRTKYKGEISASIRPEHLCRKVAIN